jgi:hypothetical protein
MQGIFMSNIENIKILASVAHESESYADSYKYHSQILESDVSDATAWINKGIAAAHMTGTEGGQIYEAIQLIQRGSELTKKSSSEEISKACISAYKRLILKLDSELLEKIKDHQKIAMPENGSTILHMMGQSVNKIVVAKSQAQSRAKSLELLKVANDHSSSVVTQGSILSLIESAMDHSKSNGKYFESIQLAESVTATYNELKRKINPAYDSDSPADMSKNKEPDIAGIVIRLVISTVLLFLIYPFASWWKIAIAMVVGLVLIGNIFLLFASKK